VALSPVCPCLSCPTHRQICPPSACGVYPSTISDAQWARLSPLLPTPAYRTSYGGRPEKHPRRRILDAVFYLVHGGLPWRALPAEFPPWPTVYYWFARWRGDGTWQRIHDMLRDQVRTATGRNPTPSAAVVDSQSVRAAATVGRASRGFDAAKRVNGRKRHLAVDTLGLLLVVLVTAAHIQDRDAGCRLLALLRQRFSTIVLVWADSGYAGRLVTWAMRTLHFTVQIIKRTTDTAGFVVQPRRWIVERTLAWLFTHRRLVHDWERLPATHEAMVYIAMIMVMSKRLAKTPTH
jgi:transposase